MRMENRVCIIDDDEAIREALKLLLYADGISSHAFASADEFLAGDKSQEYACMLLDIHMQGTDGFELFRRLIRDKAPYPIIFITGHGDIPLAVGAIKQGAFDFLTKPFERGQLLAKVKAGIAHCNGERQKMQGIHELNRRCETCTPRERAVMKLLVEGLPNKKIADALNISPRTVEIHRAHVMEKMAAESLPDLVRMAALLGNFPDVGAPEPEYPAGRK
jgi:FixJ family two-component response regulator